MKQVFSGIFVMLLCSIVACQDSESALPSDVPLISFEEASIVRSANFSPGVPYPDTINVKIGFKDGGSDLGLTWNESDPVFSSYLVYHYLDGGTIRETLDASHPSLIKYGDLEDLPPFNCQDYWVRYEHDGYGKPVDTLYVKQNVYYYNFLVDIYTKEPNGYKKWEPNKERTILCIPEFSGRFPELPARVHRSTKLLDNGSGFDIWLKNAYEGEISYKIPVYYLVHFQDKSIKLKVRIIDRKRNISNEVETSELSF